MTADWMIYCGLWSVVLAAAASLVESLLRRGPAPLRAVWILALSLSVVGPVVGYWLPRSTVAVPVEPAAASSPVAVVMTVAAIGRAATPRATVPATNLLAIVWPALSAVMFLYVAAGFVRLHRLRRRWHSANIGGMRVLVSDDTGPAVVGMLRSTIVIPEWVLRFDAHYLSLVLRHEREHQRAGDASVLAFAQLVLIAMPWNPVVWWQVRRFRLAMELDCDARVLRAEPDIRSYGNLLLEVGRPRGSLAFASAPLSARAGDLEQRIRLMTRRAGAVSKIGKSFSIAAGLLAIAIGCGLPAPKHPAPEAEPLAKAAAPAAVTTTKDAADSAIARPKPMTSNGKTARTVSPPDSTERGAALARQVKALTDSLRVRGVIGDTSTARLMEELRRRVATDSALRAADSALRAAASRDSALFAAGLRATLSVPAQTDSEAAASSITACSAGVGSNDSYVVKLLVPDSLARRNGRIEIEGGAANDARVSITLNDPQDRNRHLMSCQTGRPGTLRLYGPEAFDGRPIVVNVTGPTSVIVTTGSGQLLAGPILVTSESRKYQMTWSAVSR